MRSLFVQAGGCRDGEKHQADGDLTGDDAHRRPDAGHAAGAVVVTNACPGRAPARCKSQTIRVQHNGGWRWHSRQRTGLPSSVGRPRAAPGGERAHGVAIWLLWPTHTGPEPPDRQGQESGRETMVRQEEQLLRQARTPGKGRVVSKNGERERMGLQQPASGKLPAGT